MRYDKQKILTCSIDWFIYDYNCWIHGASMGGFLPDFADDRSLLPQVQSICSTMPDLMDRDDVIINDGLIELRFKRHLELLERLQDAGGSDNNRVIFLEEERSFDFFKNRYCELFVDMAIKGFHSYARVDIDNPLESTYHLIASPSQDAVAELKNSMNEYFRLNFIPHDLRQYFSQISITDRSVNATPPQHLF